MSQRQIASLSGVLRRQSLRTRGGTAGNGVGSWNSCSSWSRAGNHAPRDASREVPPVIPFVTRRYPKPPQRMASPSLHRYCYSTLSAISCPSSSSCSSSSIYYPILPGVLSNRRMPPKHPIGSSRTLPSRIPAAIATTTTSTSTGSSLACFSSQSNAPHPKPQRSNNNSNNNSSNNSLRNTAGMIGTGALVLFGKTKYVLAALKLTKLAPLGSMILTVGTYATFFGLPYASGMVGLILVHEIGHAAVMHAKGIPFSPMVFVPFVGAVIATKEPPRDAWEDALVAFGGPVLGSLGACAVGLAGHSTDSQLLIALADFGLMINLFNLLPLGSMDGGRIAGALSPYAGLAGVAAGGWLAYSGAVQNPLFFLILLSGGYQTARRLWDPAGYGRSLPPNYHAISRARKACIGLGYAGLVGGLALAMDWNGRYKKSPEVLRRERLESSEPTWDMR